MLFCEKCTDNQRQRHFIFTETWFVFPRHDNVMNIKKDMPLLMTKKRMEEAEKEFRCGICFLLPTDPHLCDVCVQTYCYDCVATLMVMYEHKRCPYCRYYML